VFSVQAYKTSQYAVPRAAAFFSSNIRGVHCAGLSDFSVHGAAPSQEISAVKGIFKECILLC
jgi:hypothetical protein